jgi:ElaB/YqjD/DUF883 family membrane-anchored ribosome-binding protein
LRDQTEENPLAEGTFRQRNFSRFGVLAAHHGSSGDDQGATDMPEARSSTSDFNRALGDAKKQAAGVAGEVSDAAQDLYDHASERASRLGDATNHAARKTAGSFEKALRNTIENQPYTAVAIAVGLGWLLGRMHRPL